jgi:hypothetical protein
MNGVRSFVPPTLRTVALLLMVFMVGVVMMSAQTQTNAPAKKKTTTTATKQSAQTSTYNPNAGQRVYIDPATKQIVQPTAEDAQALDSAGNKKLAKKALAAPAIAAEPQEFVTESGAFGMVLPEESMAYAVATKSADGKLSMGCIEGKKKADKVVKSNSKPAPAKTEVLDEK